MEKDSPPVGPDAIVLVLFESFMPASRRFRCKISLTAPFGGINAGVISACRLPQAVVCKEGESPASLGTAGRDGAVYSPRNSPLPCLLTSARAKIIILISPNSSGLQTPNYFQIPRARLFVLGATRLDNSLRAGMG